MCRGSRAISLAQEMEFVLPSPACSSVPGPSPPAFTIHSQNCSVPERSHPLCAEEMLLTSSLGPPRTTFYCVSVMCYVLGKTLYFLIQEHANSWFSPLYRRANGGLRRVRRLAQSHAAGEHSSWCIHLSSKPKVHLLHPTAWFFYHIWHHTCLLPFRRCFQNC